ncbi:MAG: peptidylprolyl isomerase [Planctomycetota bacterium]|jgi:peptidyl-prolyl cis-trans isomerase A (cyclophilin A)
MKKTILIALVLICSTTLLAKEGKKSGKTSKNPVAEIKTSHGDIHVELFAKDAPKTVENFLGLAEGKKEFKDPKTGQMVERPFFDGLIFHRVIKGFMIQGGCPLGNGMGGPGYKFEDEISAKSLGLDKLKAVENKKHHPWLLIRSQRDFQRVVLQPLLYEMGIESQKDLDARQAEVDKAVAKLTLKDVYENQGYKYNDKLVSHHPKKGVIAMANSGPGTNGSQFFINLEDTPHLTGKHTVFGKVVKGMDVVEKIGDVKVGAGSRPVEPVKILSVRRLKVKKK